MTDFCFEKQYDRLRQRFGNQAFDLEFKAHVREVCHPMGDNEIKDLVETFVQCRTHDQPPSLTQFKSAAAFAGNPYFREAVKNMNREWLGRVKPESKIFDEGPSLLDKAKLKLKKAFEKFKASLK